MNDPNQPKPPVGKVVIVDDAPDTLEIISVQLHIRSCLRGSCIAGSNKYPGYFFTLGKLPYDSMFPASGTQYKDVHFPIKLCIPNVILQTEIQNL